MNAVSDLQALTPRLREMMTILLPVWRAETAVMSLEEVCEACKQINYILAMTARLSRAGGLP